MADKLGSTIAERTKWKIVILEAVYECAILTAKRMMTKRKIAKRMDMVPMI